MTGRTVVAGILLALEACLPVIKPRKSKPELVQGDVGYETTVQVKFLGVGGFMVRLGHEAFMTAPMYSNPFALKLLPPEQPIPPQTELIAKYHHPTRHPEEIKAILVGHAHYDHLIDVVPIWLGMNPRPWIYGSAGMQNVIAGYDSAGGPVQAGKTVALDGVADYRQCKNPQPCDNCTVDETCPTHPQVAGSWSAVPGSRIRVMALCAAHPKQFADKHHWPGCLKIPRTTPPKYSCDYKEGQVFAYLVDFLDANGKPVFRTYYQDTAADAKEGWGTIPPELLADRKVDLMLLSGGNWNTFNSSELVAKDTGVRYLVMGHWEDFFFPQDVPTHEIPNLELGEYLKLLESVTGKDPLLPEPQVMMHFPM